MPVSRCQRRSSAHRLQFDMVRSTPTSRLTHISYIPKHIANSQARRRQLCCLRHVFDAGSLPPPMSTCHRAAHNRLWVLCNCGRIIDHPTNISLVECPTCNLADLWHDAVSRRSFLFVLAVVTAANLMPVRSIERCSSPIANSSIRWVMWSPRRGQNERPIHLMSMLHRSWLIAVCSWLGFVCILSKTPHSQ